MMSREMAIQYSLLLRERINRMFEINRDAYVSRELELAERYALSVDSFLREQKWEVSKVPKVAPIPTSEWMRDQVLRSPLEENKSETKEGQNTETRN